MIDLKRKEYSAKLTINWLRAATSLESFCPAMKGFAYKQFNISRILEDINVLLGIRNAQINIEPVHNVFDGDYPALSALNAEKNTATLFLSRKYNHNNEH